MTTFRCDWPSCPNTTEEWAQDGWAQCFDHADDVPFLCDPCLLCPQHADQYDELGSNPEYIPPADTRH
jgi:hypothetical protein